ncbi:MAG: cytochrome c oxidase accessory protein CcoG [Candidatus Xenobia bacterium]
MSTGPRDVPESPDSARLAAGRSTREATEALPPEAVTAPHRKVYPRRVRGPWRSRRWGLSVFLQVVLFVLPWIEWHGRQAVLIDLPDRRLYLFGLVFWPQETYFLLLILIFLAVLLFLSTAVAGRMWCGYACPQTLLTEMFVVVERFFEGERAAQIRLDRAPWSVEKTLRKSGKYLVWTIMAIWLGITFVGYFDPIRHLRVTQHLLAITFVAACALFDFGWFREQFCQYVCPYARFQGAMFDPDTLIVAYDNQRGEPRGKLKAPGKGDCVDCSLCVQVCPMGIDIRNGLQLECIACTACMDACDSVMDKTGRPRGLIRYSSLSALEGRSPKVMRTRIIIYAVLLSVLCFVFADLLAHRAPVEMDVLRQVTGNVFAASADGRIMNVYTLKLMNRSLDDHQVRISVSGLPGAELVMQENPVHLPADSAVDVRALVVHAPAGLPPVSHIQFNLQEGTSQRTVDSTFDGPGLRAP